MESWVIMSLLASSFSTPHWGLKILVNKNTSANTHIYTTFTHTHAMSFFFLLFPSCAYAHPSGCAGVCTHMPSMNLCQHCLGSGPQQLSIKLLVSWSSNSFWIAHFASPVNTSCSPSSKLLLEVSFLNKSDSFKLLLCEKTLYLVPQCLLRKVHTPRHDIQWLL